ncbi:MAG: aspartate-semialdehyde dehydrogenase, partial [Thermoleophilaceae bacterium]
MRVAVVGATGAVGSTILGVMRERAFPADEIVPFASERSAGRTLDYGERDLTVAGLSAAAIQGFARGWFS